MSEFILELYSEEIPPNLQINARNDLLAKIKSSLIEENLKTLSIKKQEDREQILAWYYANAFNENYPLTRKEFKFLLEGQAWPRFLDYITIANPALLGGVPYDTENEKQKCLALFIEQAKENLERTPRPFPKLVINEKKDKLEDFEFSDMKIIGYNPYKSISSNMAV